MSERALEQAVVGADAAAYAYGVLGPWLDPAGQRRARRALAAHRSARSRWQATASEPVDTPAVFDLPTPVTEAAEARALAILVERRLVAVYADLAATVSGDLRAQAVTDAMACEARAVTWGAATTAFAGG